jgi:hypothetical protein
VNATLVISLPAKPAGYPVKIAPWTLPLGADGKMQNVEVGSRKEFLDVLKKNGLRELETESDNLVQGGTFKKDREREFKEKLDADTSAMAADYARFKSNPEQARQVIDKACKAGQAVHELSGG